MEAGHVESKTVVSTEIKDTHDSLSPATKLDICKN